LINALIWKVNSLIYEGHGPKAYRCIREELPKEAKWVLNYTQVVRIPTVEISGRAAVAAAAQEGGLRRVLRLREAEQQAQRLEDEQSPWADAYAHCLRASIDAMRGHAESARVRLTRAEQGFAAADMEVLAALVKRRRGTLLQGAEGQAIVAAADELLKLRGIINPLRWMCMMTPGWPQSATPSL
jgi:hypothetical protein